MTANSFQFLIFLTIASYIIASLIGAYQWFRLRTRLDDTDSRRLALMVGLLQAGIGIGGFCAIIANGYRPMNIYYPAMFVSWHWLGQVLISLGTWAFVLHNVGYAKRRNGKGILRDAERT